MSDIWTRKGRSKATIEHSNIRDTRRALGYLGIPVAPGGHLDIKALGHLGQSDTWALR